MICNLLKENFIYKCFVEYFNKFDTDEPVIVDGGVNIGLAIYYFKMMYPKCRIIGFEPWDKAYKIVCNNVKKNKWDNVEIFPYGLADKNKKQLFAGDDENSLGGKVIQGEKKEMGVAIECRKLSSYLKQHIDFLKLDFEGMETKVFKEIKKYLKNIDNIFLEFHSNEELKANGNSLALILKLLEENSFSYEVSRSYAYTQVTVKRPMWHVGKNVSMLVFAKREKRS